MSMLQEELAPDDPGFVDNDALILQDDSTTEVSADDSPDPESETSFDVHYLLGLV